MEFSLVGFLYGDVENLLLLLESVSTPKKGIFFLLMLNSVVKFCTDFFYESLFKDC